MVANDLRHRLTDSRHRPRVLELANRGVTRDRRGDVFELVVSVEVDLPAELLELLGKAGFHQMNGALIYTRSWLAAIVR